MNERIASMIGELRISHSGFVETREDAVNEIRILASLKHPSVIRYCESFYEQDKLYIVSDFGFSGVISCTIRANPLS